MASVRELMSSEIVTVEPAATVAEAATVMGARRVGSAVILEGGSLAGIFTERDVLRALAADFNAPHEPVSQWMTRRPATIDANAPANEALARMLDGGFRHLPVTENGDLVGMVSMRDVAGGS